jgi:hypothetical protein
MSDTPQTDFAVGQHDPWGQSTQVVLASFARQLERELAEAQKCLREVLLELASAMNVRDSRYDGWRKAAGM